MKSHSSIISFIILCGTAFTIAGAPGPTIPPLVPITVQNARQVTLLREYPLPDVRSAAFSPDGSTMITSSGNQDIFSIKFWRVADWKLL
jgi:hypothetical protein